MDPKIAEWSNFIGNIGCTLGTYIFMLLYTFLAFTSSFCGFDYVVVAGIILAYYGMNCHTKNEIRSRLPDLAIRWGSTNVWMTGLMISVFSDWFIKGFDSLFHNILIGGTLLSVILFYGNETYLISQDTPRFPFSVRECLKYPKSKR